MCVGGEAGWVVGYTNGTVLVLSQRATCIYIYIYTRADLSLCSDRAVWIRSQMDQIAEWTWSASFVSKVDLMSDVDRRVKWIYRRGWACYAMLNAMLCSMLCYALCYAMLYGDAVLLTF